GQPGAVARPRRDGDGVLRLEGDRREPAHGEGLRGHRAGREAGRPDGRQAQRGAREEPPRRVQADQPARRSRWWWHAAPAAAPATQPVVAGLPEALVAILVCPKTKQRLIYFPRGEADTDESLGFLVSVAGRLRYRIDDGVPVLLVEEAVELTVDALDRLLSRA